MSKADREKVYENVSAQVSYTFISSAYWQAPAMLADLATFIPRNGVA